MQVRSVLTRVVFGLLVVAVATATLVFEHVSHAHAADSLGTFTEYSAPSVSPGAITTGPDGNLWYTDGQSNQVVQVTPTGTFTAYNVPTTNADLYGLTSGPDGNLWVTEVAGNQIAKITTTGTVTEYPVPVDSYLRSPGDLTAGPDGNLWFTSQTYIGKITTAGVVTEYAMPSSAVNAPGSITSGPDGNLWFTEGQNNSVGRITPTGTITEFPLAGTGHNPGRITAGPDGNLWFGYGSTIGTQAYVATISTGGTPGREFAIPTVTAQPSGITTGPDGNMWFGEGGTGVSKVAKLGTAPTPEGEFTPLAPARILDTRDGTGGHLGKLGAGQQFDVQINGQGGVPASGVSAVVFNATATDPTAASYLTVWPSGLSRPSPSNLNFVPGQTVPNLVTVAVSGDGKVSVYNNAGATHVIFDVVGYYSDATGSFGSRFHAVTPLRDFDTRYGTGGVGTSPLGSGQTLHFKVTGKGGVPSNGVTSVVMNVTVTQPTSSGYLTVFPDGITRPNASNLNFVAGLTVPNLVLVKVPANGIVDFYNFSNFGGTLHLLADVVGYYDGDKTTEAGRLVTGPPVRLIDTRVSSPAPSPGCISGGATLSLTFSSPQIAAVVLNVTVTQPTASGYVTAYPFPGIPPNTSTVNYVPGQTVPNLAMVKLGTGGGVGFFNYAGCTHLVIDAFGAFTSASAAPPSPLAAADESDPLKPLVDVKERELG